MIGPLYLAKEGHHKVSPYSRKMTQFSHNKVILDVSFINILVKTFYVASKNACFSFDNCCSKSLNTFLKLLKIIKKNFEYVIYIVGGVYAAYSQKKL